MAKKVRFPLEMNAGIEVRDVVSLRENFCLERVMQYFLDGRLVVWLRDRYENELADKIEKLDARDVLLEEKVCKILGVEFDEGIQERSKKIAKLKDLSAEKEYINHIDAMAFEQDEIYDLLDEDVKTIYLCGERFVIPLAQEGVTYVGVNKPIVVVDSKTKVDWLRKNIQLLNVQYDEAYKKVEEEYNANHGKLTLTYCTGSDLNILLSNTNLREAQDLFAIVGFQIHNVNYDFENNNMKEISEVIYKSQLTLTFDEFENRL